MDLLKIAENAKKASLALSGINAEIKNNALLAIKTALIANQAAIIEANQHDLTNAKELASPVLKRLKFDADKIKDVIKGIDDLISFPDPVGQTLSARELDKGLELFKVSCPIGVIGVIFESRPDALVQISTLCLKSGNAVLLKGGSEAAATNKILAALISEAAVSAGVPEGWLGLLETRQDVNAMLAFDQYIDLIIPRGSNAFVSYIMEHTKIPVLGHADGICHVYVDAEADIAMAVQIVVDSKCQYVAVCNAAETLLVHKGIVDSFLPAIAKALAAKSVELRGCALTCAIIPALPATEADWATEYLDYILSVKVVESLDDAISHINQYGSGHTDAIVTSNKGNALRFLNNVDAANVFHNCSTRFCDGYCYGLGAEVGISTNKIHARGPVGIEGLLIYKWMLLGHGELKADYTGANAKAFTHKELNKEFGV